MLEPGQSVSPGNTYVKRSHGLPKKKIFFDDFFHHRVRASIGTYVETSPCSLLKNSPSYIVSSFFGINATVEKTGQVWSDLNPALEGDIIATLQGTSAAERLSARVMRSISLYGRDDSGTDISMRWVKIFLVGTYLEVQAVCPKTQVAISTSIIHALRTGNDSDYRAQEI